MANSSSDGQRQVPPIVGLGASAGGLEALQQFFQCVPADLGAAYVVIMHLAPDRDSDLPAILGRATDMPVIQVGDHAHERLAPDTVYVIAPDRKLEISDRSVGASRFEQPHGQRVAIDLFFRSLGAANSDIYAVVLSGGGADGAIGAKAVKEAGGVVLVQDPAEAVHDSMPRAVVATGAADVIAPMDELAKRLTSLVGARGRIPRLLAPTEDQPALEADEQTALERLLDVLHRRTGHDFSNYKRTTVLRRLVRRMQLHHSTSVPEYLAYLERDPDEVQRLFRDLLITVTTFFRDPAAWSALREHVVVPLVERNGPDETLRCWVPGCATGEEAYTVAMLFSEELERRNARRELIVFASDIDDRALEVAREGIYPASIVADVPEAQLDRWFRAAGDHYRVVGQLRERVVFAHHSLQRDPPFSRLHLVSCRNLLIYLDRPLQDHVMEVFRYACRDDGYLFLGSSETASPELFAPVVKEHCIYRTRAGRGERRYLPSRLPTGTPRPPPARGSERRAPHPEYPAEVHRTTLEQLAPPSVLVDDRWRIVHLSESAGRFLQPAGGAPSFGLVEIVRPELRGEVTVALRRAFESHDRFLSEFVPVRFNGDARRVAVLVQARHAGGAASPQALVTFLEAGPVTSAEAAANARPGNEREQALLEKLHQAELHIEHLHAEHHASEEDLRAANEELQSLNEEYRSTTEELETSKEELQSINEELQTVNAELKLKLEEISRAHDDLENLMAATDIATLFVDRDLCIQRFTPQLAHIFNVKAHDTGRPIGDITHNLAYRELDRDARQVLAELAPVERDVMGAGGRSFIVRLRPYRTARDQIDGVVVTLVDVTKLKRAEAVLRESEERFRALVAASAQMVWTTDAEGAVVDDSDSWRAFTGQSEAQRQGLGWLNALHPEDRERARREWRQAVASERTLDTEFRVYHAPSGAYRWTSVRAVPLRLPDGSVRGWVGMNIDITERKAAEDSLRESDERKDEFLAMLGHELRNPLAAIRNSVQAALAAARSQGGSAGAEVAQRALAVVERQSRHMTHLVNDLLDITRITRNKLELHRRPIRLNDSIEHIVSALQPPLEEHRLELTLDLAADLYVDADPDRLAQVLDNLMRNAVTFTPPGGTVTLATRRQSDELALIAVSDTGEGIEPEEITRLFDPYRQGARRQSDGLGLGLTLVKRLVELHGGTVTAHSEGAGHGSEFRFTLPMAAAPAAVAEAPALPERPAARRILVVDDQADVADTLAGLLVELGQEVAVAHSGRAGLQLALERRPQIALLDLSMPGMSGHELAERLREHFAPEELTLVALTGHGNRAASLAAGPFQHYLLKPAEVDALVELLHALPSAPP